MPETFGLIFTIRGTPSDPKGHPLPKARLTGKQQWTAKAKRYVMWKRHVVDAFLDGLHHSPEIKKMATLRVALGEKPIPRVDGKMYMHIKAKYKNHKHPDTENVFGSIADALFENDSNLAGEFDFSVASEEGGDHGSVHVVLGLPEGTFDLPQIMYETRKTNRSPRARSRKKVSVV